MFINIITELRRLNKMKMITVAYKASVPFNTIMLNGVGLDGTNSTEVTSVTSSNTCLFQKFLNSFGIFEPNHDPVPDDGVLALHAEVAGLRELHQVGYKVVKQLAFKLK